MGHKFGEAFFNDMVDRGRRELGGLFFDGSNIAQPMYPLRGSYEPSKQPDGPEPEANGPGLEDAYAAKFTRDDPGKDDRDTGFERE
jgi:hypothetical protein